jgi:hypothetical protein
MHRIPGQGGRALFGKAGHAVGAYKVVTVDLLERELAAFEGQIDHHLVMRGLLYGRGSRGECGYENDD